MDQHEYAREEGFCREKMWSVSLQSSVHCTVSITNSISSIDGENAVLRVWGGGVGGGWVVWVFLAAQKAALYRLTFR